MKILKTLLKSICFPIFLFVLILVEIVLFFFEKLLWKFDNKTSFIDMIRVYWREL